jgi:hypothetical protein
MRRLFWIACFVAAVAGPYLWSNPQVATAWKDRALALLRQLTAAPPATPADFADGPYAGATTGASAGFESDQFVSAFKPLDTSPPPLSAGGDEPSPASSPLDSGFADPRSTGPRLAGPRLAGPGSGDLGTLFRFDIGPEWITSQWSRVSTIRADEGWVGMRVPVVTGMAADDLAGSLTYYFDGWSRLQRIAFHGATGDARRLIAWSESQGLRREPAFAAELFTRRWKGRATSVLAVQRPAVITSTQPFQQQEILLELGPPESRFEVSREMQAWLRANQPRR